MSSRLTVRSRFALVLTGAAVVLAGCGGSSGSSSASSSAPSTTPSSQPSKQPSIGFEGVALEQGPVLAPASTTGTAPVDGIKCGATEQLAYHIHVHLAVFVDGAPRALPAGIGIPGSQVEQSAEGPVAVGGSCIYWLHTHAPDGIIHVESPTARVYTLGQFFDEWHQPLNPGTVATATGPVSAFVNGKVWKQNPRSIPLVPHAVIQLNVGSPAIPFRPMSWSGLQL